MFQGMEYVYEVYLEKMLFQGGLRSYYLISLHSVPIVKRVEHHIGYPIFDGVPNHFPLPNVGYSISKR